METLAAYRQHILAGGLFIEINGTAADPFMASLDDRTGKDDGLLRLHISGHYSYPGAAQNATRVYNQQLSHSGNLDLVEGDFTSAGGKRHRQIFMLNLGSKPRATVTAGPRRGLTVAVVIRRMATSITAPARSRSTSDRRHGRLTTAPSTSRAPVTGRGTTRAATRLWGCATWRPRSPQILGAPQWINYDGCYSLYSVAADSHTAYFAGHELWSQAPDGCKKFHLDPHAISAPGFEGLSPHTGRLILNPTSRAGSAPMTW